MPVVQRIEQRSYKSLLLQIIVEWSSSKALDRPVVWYHMKLLLEKVVKNKEKKKWTKRREQIGKKKRQIINISLVEINAILAPFGDAFFSQFVYIKCVCICTTERERDQ